MRAGEIARSCRSLRRAAVFDSFTVVRAAFFKVITWLGGPPGEPFTASCKGVGRWGIEDSSDVVEQVGFGERFLDEDDAEVEGAL